MKKFLKLLSRASRAAASYFRKPKPAKPAKMVFTDLPKFFCSTCDRYIPSDKVIPCGTEEGPGNTSGATYENFVIIKWGLECHGEHSIHKMTIPFYLLHRDGVIGRVEVFQTKLASKGAFSSYDTYLKELERSRLAAGQHHPKVLAHYQSQVAQARALQVEYFTNRLAEVERMVEVLPAVGMMAEALGAELAFANYAERLRSSVDFIRKALKQAKVWAGIPVEPGTGDYLKLYQEQTEQAKSMDGFITGLSARAIKTDDQAAKPLDYGFLSDVEKDK